MLTGRGTAILGGAAVMWIGSRIAGAHELHIVAVGLAALVPLSLLLVRWSRPRLHVTRRLATPRASAGARVRVDLAFENRGHRQTPFLLIEDRVPSTFGAPARAVLASLPSGGRQTVSYRLLCRARGRYLIGPLRVVVTDPFGIARSRIEVPGRHDLIVHPEIERLDRERSAPPTGVTGEAPTRQLYRTGEDFYMMRPYEMGDDLRRIHWPSTARTGDLMIRQEEAVRSADAVLLLDTRTVALGGAGAAFERAVSAAASIGAHQLRRGATLLLTTPELAPRTVARETFLDTLAAVAPSWERGISPALLRLRRVVSGAPALTVVTRVPTGEEVAALTRVGGVFGPRLAVLVHRRAPADVPLPHRDRVLRDTDAARVSLTRAGWDVLVLAPDGKLRDVWHLRSERPDRATAARFS